jgi:hypothetical protein
MKLEPNFEWIYTRPDTMRWGAFNRKQVSWYVKASPQCSKSQIVFFTTLQILWHMDVADAGLPGTVAAGVEIQNSNHDIRLYLHGQLLQEELPPALEETTTMPANVDHNPCPPFHRPSVIISQLPPPYLPFHHLYLVNILEILIHITIRINILKQQQWDHNLHLNNNNIPLPLLLVSNAMQTHNNIQTKMIL